MAMFDGIVPELSKIGHFKKFKSINSEIQDAKGKLLASGNKTMFWSNNIPSNLGTINEMESISIQIKAISLIDVAPSYSLTSGTLPPGLSLTPTGYISGMTMNLSHENTYTFIISANDNQTTISKQFSLTVNAVNDPITWITASALGDMTDTYISIQLSAYDPDSTVTFSIVSGNLPVGVSLSSSGLISGANPRDNQTYTFTVRATDGDNQVDREFSFLAFNEAPVWITASDLGTVSGISFSKTLSASDNDSTSLSYFLAPGSSLPSGLNLSNTGILSGTNPLTNTTYYFDVVVSDGVNTVTKTFYFYSFNAAPTWNTTSNLGRFNTNTINIQLSASDSEGEVLTYSVVAGSLPSGLTLSNSGLISGSNPYTGSTSTFTVAVSDNANSVNREFTMLCEVAAGEVIYSSVGNYSFSVPSGVYSIDALAVAGATDATVVGNMSVTKGMFLEETMGKKYSGIPTDIVKAFGKYIMGVNVSGGLGYLFSSDDLISWQPYKSFGTSEAFLGLTFDGTTLVLASSSGNVRYSTNGTTYTSVSSGLSSLSRVRNFNNIWIFSSSSATSIKYTTNLSTFSTATPFSPYGVYDISYGNGLYVAVGVSGKISTSPDLTTWTTRVSNTTSTLFSITYGNGKFIAIGSSIMVQSTDGITWTVVSSGLSTMSNVFWLNDAYVVCGGAGTTALLATSSDGDTWSNVSGTSSFPMSTVYYDNGVYFAGGYYYGVGNSLSTLTNSYRQLLSSTVTRAKKVNNIQFLLGDGGVIYRTSDGINYTSTTTGFGSYIMDMAFNGNIYVIVGQSGKLYSSSDSTTWTARTSNAASYLYSVCYGNNIFLSQVSTTTNTITSSDGISWVSNSTNLPDGTTIKDLIFVNGLFVGVGYSTTYTNGLIATTTDGISWNVIESPIAVAGQLVKILHDGSKYTIIHNNSSSAIKITQSQDLVNFNNVSITGLTTYSTIDIARDENTGNMVIMTPNGVYSYSKDGGVSWTTKTINIYSGTSPLSAVGYLSSSFYLYGIYSIIQKLTLVGQGATNADATLTRPGTEGFSLAAPNSNGNYGKLSGVACYKNNIPVTPNNIISVSVPSLDGAVRIIWGSGRDYPNNAT